MSYTFKQLNATSKDYKDRVCKLHECRAYASGNIDQFSEDLLPMRIGEDRGIYNKRISMFTFTPLISTSLSNLIDRFAQGQVVVSNCGSLLLESGMRQDEGKFLASMLNTALIDSKVGLLTVATGENKKFSISNRVVLDDNVLAYSPEDNSYKLRFITTHIDLMSGEESFNYEWIIIKGTTLSIYNAYRVKKGEDPGDETLLTPTTVLVNLLPVHIHWLHIPSNKSVVALCLPKQKEHIRIENSRATAAYAAGYIQRVFTPVETPDAALGPLLSQRPDTGNEHVMIADKFEFVEMKGSSLYAQGLVLEDIRRAIKHMVALSGLSWTEAPTQTSGVSKDIENESIEASLVAYGNLVIKFWQSVLTEYALLFGECIPEVSGYDDFSMETSGNALSVLERAVSLSAYIAPTAIKQASLVASKAISEGGRQSLMSRIEEEIDV